MSLPTDDKERKALPVFTGPLMYFPDAIAEIARVCKIGNDQHNPGEPLHWARGKSMDQMNTALRHMMDHGTGTVKDSDGAYHMAKAAWRCLAELQLTIEREREASKEDAVIDALYPVKPTAFGTPLKSISVGDRVCTNTGYRGTVSAINASDRTFMLDIDSDQVARHVIGPFGPWTFDELERISP